jgi:transketolase
VWRPCDAAETAQAWACAIERRAPTCLLLSRQNLRCVARVDEQLQGIASGGYVLRDWSDEDELGRDAADRVVLIATGSEVALALDAVEALALDGIAARVVSMPSTTVFDRQPRAWRDAVLPPGVPRVAVEAGVTSFWRKYVGLEGDVVGIDSFGESASADALFGFFELTALHVARVARATARGEHSRVERRA